MYPTILQIIGIGLAATALLLAIEQHFAASFRAKKANIIDHIDGSLKDIENKAKEINITVYDKDYFIEIQNKNRNLKNLDWDDISTLSNITNIMKAEKIFTSMIFLLSFDYWILILISSAEETMLHNSKFLHFIDLRKLIDTETVFTVTWVTLLVHLAFILFYYVKIHRVFDELNRHNESFAAALDEARVKLRIDAAPTP